MIQKSLPCDALVMKMEKTHSIHRQFTPTPVLNALGRTYRGERTMLQTPMPCGIVLRCR